MAEVKAPERIWATGWGTPNPDDESGTFVSVGSRYPNKPNHDAKQYVDADLHDDLVKAADELMRQMEDFANMPDADIRDCEWKDGWNACLPGLRGKARAALTAYRKARGDTE